MVRKDQNFRQIINNVHIDRVLERATPNEQDMPNQTSINDTSANGLSQMRYTPISTRREGDDSRMVKTFDGSDAVAIVNYNRTELPGTLNGVKLHTSQLPTKPELKIDIMIGQNIFA